MREKLIELLSQVQDFGIKRTHRMAHPKLPKNEEIADHLIANGVTIQKWIPVTERLPENTEKVLALSKSQFGNGYLSWLVRYNPDVGAFYDYDSEWGNIKIHNITHWMPLPEPPKGE